MPGSSVASTSRPTTALVDGRSERWSEASIPARGVARFREIADIVDTRAASLFEA